MHLLDQVHCINFLYVLVLVRRTEVNVNILQRKGPNLVCKELFYDEDVVQIYISNMVGQVHVKHVLANVFQAGVMRTGEKQFEKTRTHTNMNKQVCILKKVFFFY